MDVTLFVQLALWGLWAGFLSAAVLGVAEYAAGKIRKHSSFIIWSHIANRLFHAYTRHIPVRYQFILHSATHVAYHTLWGMLLVLASGAALLASFTGNIIVYFLILFLQNATVLHILGLSPLPWKWDVSYLLKEIITKIIYAAVLAFLFVFVIFPLFLG